MKTLFQLLMTAGLLLMMLDISSCSRHYTNENTTLLFGQCIDAVTKCPVGLINLCVESTDKSTAITATSNSNGEFHVAVPNNDNHYYSLYVHDARYKMVNPNQGFESPENPQVWQLLPAGTRP